MGSLNTAGNQAAWLPHAKAPSFTISQAPLAQPSPRQILVRNHALAINPIDYKLQRFAVYPITYPAILGQDVAGQVIATGSSVTRFRIGDRVFGCAAGFATKKESDKAFQTHTVLEDVLAAKIPDAVSYEEAAVLPLATITAAAGLFNEDLLGLALPGSEAGAAAAAAAAAATTATAGKTLVVWGGASSVGSCAVQLARAAGYDVVSTASAKNFDYVKDLGAKYVFNYHDEDVVEQMLRACGQSEVVGVFDAVGGKAWTPCLEIAQRVPNCTRRFVATVTPGFPDPPEGVGIKQMFSLSVRENGVGERIWADWIEEAIEKGVYRPKPEPEVVGHGLEAIQIGVDRIGEGVSRSKLVVSLP